MRNSSAPRVKKFPAAKQRRMDELLNKNSAGTITPAEKQRLKVLVDEAEKLMVDNAKLVAKFAKSQSPTAPTDAVPVTVWVNPGVTES